MLSALIHSRLDPAGVAIQSAIDHLIGEEGEEAWPLVKAGMVVHQTEGRLIYERGLDRRVEADRIIFLSRHTSMHPVPVLTIHVTGNFTEAAYGGEVHELAAADPKMMQAVLRNLSMYAPAGYRVSYEVTHHGPTDLAIPSFFVEIGSSEDEWRDPSAAEAVARSVLSAEPIIDPVPLIGFGGTHYAVRQTSIAQETRGAFGHIAHSREAPALSSAMIRLMAEKSGAVAGYIDRKSLPAAQVDRISRLLAAADLPLLSEGMLKEMGDLPWSTWCRARELASGIASRAVLRNHGMRDDQELTVVTIPEDLLNEALKGNEEEFLDLLDAATPCIRVETNGRLALPSFIGYQVDASQVASDLITLCVQLITKHSHAVVEGDRLIIRRDRFDPEKARMLGVPSGPLFGRLASGQVVSVGGRTIRPDMVNSCVQMEIQIPGLERYT